MNSAPYQDDPQPGDLYFLEADYRDIPAGLWIVGEAGEILTLSRYEVEPDDTAPEEMVRIARPDFLQHFARIVSHVFFTQG